MTDPKVYLVVSGEYSDYTVWCAFTTYDLAITYVAHRNKVPPDIQRRYQELIDIVATEHHSSPTVWKKLGQLKHDHQDWREHRDIDYYRVETIDLHDSLPIVKQEPKPDA